MRQSVSNLATDVKSLDCDFLAFSSHKIFGPYGIGVLYAKADLLEAMPPYQGGGSMISDVTWEATTWAAAPHKFEAGTPAIAEAVGLEQALLYVEKLGFENIAAHEHRLISQALDEMKALTGFKILSRAKDHAAILSFTMEGAHASDIGTVLDQQGIAIRAGHHCCQPLMRKLGIPATARASFSIYNTPGEVTAFVASLQKAQEFFR